jgi:hypothetical protein
MDGILKLLIRLCFDAGPAQISEFLLRCSKKMEGPMTKDFTGELFLYD